jgi:parallel beta-helix repeat protein
MLALAVLVAAGPSAARAATTIHVYPGYNVQAKIDRASSGTVIILHAGTYSKLRLRSGITLRGAGDGAAVVTGATGSWDAGIWIKGVSNATVRGLTIRGNRMGIFIRDAPGTLIEDNVIVDNAYGVEVHARTTGSVIRHNVIRENDRRMDAGRRAGGINLFKTYGGVRITGNRIWGNDSVGIEIFAAKSARIERNVIAGSADAIETGTDAGGSCRYNRIVRNVIFNAGKQAEERGIWLRCLSQSLVAHNTIYGMDKHAIGVTSSGSFSGPMSDLRILNNALVKGRGFWISGGLPRTVTIDFNNLRACTTARCPAFGHLVATLGSTNYETVRQFRAGTRHMDHGVSVSPGFRHWASSDMIDRGKRLSITYAGTAPDLGRWEAR